MDLHVTLSGRGDLAARIYRQLLDAILDGCLRAGDRLPPTRELARTLDVSRNTVAVACDRITAEGFVVSRVGAGTFVAAPAADRKRGRRARGGTGILPVWRDVPVSGGVTEAPQFDFLGAPASLHPALRAAKQLSDWQGDLAVQAALARFIDEGLLARHVRRAAREYGERRDRVKAGLVEEFAGRLEPRRGRATPLRALRSTRDGRGPGSAFQGAKARRAARRPR